MRPTPSGGIALIGALAALLSMMAERAQAWGALAVGTAGGNSVTASVVGKATEGAASEAALRACRTTKSGSEEAREACTVVVTFHGDSFAFAGSAWAIAADEQSARKVASAQCEDAQCTRVVSGCDARTSAR